MALISVIIATRNRPHLLRRCVESAQNAGSDVDIIVVDDESTAETAELCKGLAGVKYVRVQRRQGLGGARNVGLVASRSEFVTFLDDDDIRLPGSLDRQLELLARDPDAGLIYGQALIGKEDLPPSPDRYPSECPQGDVFWRLLTRNFIPCGSVLFRRACLSRVGMMADNILGIEDWDLWVRIGEIYPMLAIETPVFVWRQARPDSAQLTSQADQIVARCVRQFRQWMKLSRVQEAAPATRRIIWRDFSENMAEHLIWESLRAMRQGKLAQSLKNLVVVTELDPLTLGRLVGHRVFKRRRPASQESDAFGIQSGTA